MGCALTLEPCAGLLLEDPARGFTLACLLAVWQPLQADHKDGEYSDMQWVEKQMAKGMGIPVLELRFEEAEVSWMKPDGEFVGDKRDETVFKQRVEKFLCDNEL